MVVKMVDLPLPRGVRDLTPNEALFRNELLKRIERVFQNFGFLLIDTPMIEKLSVLKAKGGIGEDAKLIYEIKDDDIGLRYDKTVSLARYMASHQNLPLPFRRYDIGRAWRREEPQRLRYREFTQADADIIGGESSLADAEVMALGASVLDAVGIPYRIEVNDRALMDRCLQKLGARPEQNVEIMRALDKLEKIGEQKVAELIGKAGVDSETTDRIVSFAMAHGANEEKLLQIESLLGDGESTKEIRMTLELLALYPIKGKAVINSGMVRGFDYYTGIIFEYREIASGGVSPTICAGGRYDKLIGMLGGRPMPAVGFAIGVDRLLDMLDFSAAGEYTYSRVFVAWINRKNYGYALSVTNSLRAAGIPAEANISGRNLSNQLAYAGSIRVKYAIIIGDSEEQEGVVKLRNLVNGSESKLALSDAVRTIRGE